MEEEYTEASTRDLRLAEGRDRGPLTADELTKLLTGPSDADALD